MNKLVLTYKGGILAIGKIPIAMEYVAPPPPEEQPILQFITDASVFNPGVTLS